MLPDEEMSLWLEYPLDDSLETTYCSDIFGDLVYPNIQLLRDSFTHKQNTAPQDGHACEADAQKNADVAMVLGVKRAVGLLSHPGAEAFDKVRTSMQPIASKSSHSKTLPIASKSSHSKTLEVDLSSNFNNSQALDVAPIQPAKAGPLDLLDFACPGAQSQENLMNIGAHNKPSNIEGVKQQLGKTGTEDLASQESSFAGSTTTVVSEIGPCKGINLQHKQQTESIHRVTDGHLVSSPCQSHSADVFNGKNVELDACWHQSAADSTVTAVERGAEVLGITELTNLSPSRGSGNSTDKSEKEGSMAVCKRKASQGDEPDEHENFEPSTGQKSSGHSNAAKRSRAAEIHNLSERRRRERINEKMRALQELIPNSNKTDKASMLDEAIEYLKLLQSQIQMMSMKTGIGIPTMMMPMGMHHLQTQQILAVPHGGVGFGMEMGIPEIGIPAGGRHVVPIEGISQQARALHTMDAACFQPRSSSLSNMKPQNYFQIPGLPTWGVVEPCMALQSHQQLQPVPLNMHMNMGPHTPFLQQHQQIRRHQLPKMNREDKSNH